MGALDFLGDELEALRARGLWRTLEPLASAQGASVTLATGERLANFSSNDYLGLASDPRLVRAAQEASGRWGCGGGAARLIVGDLLEHHALEAELAAHKGAERAILFSSGWQANVGVIPSLVGPGDLVVSDALNHASIIDGIRLSKAKCVVVPHGDVGAVRAALDQPARRKLVATDAIFSMDGDVAPLAELRALCDDHGAILYVDEAHATGVLGPTGAGACEAAGIRADVVMGTLGKALGSFGAYVAGSSLLCEWLLQRCRSFVFTTALPPSACAAARAALRIVREEPERRARLMANAVHFAEGCEALGYDVLGSRTPVVPVIVGAPGAALEAAASVRARGVLARAIRPPTVPEGTSRLRFALRADHTEEQIEAALAALRSLRGGR